MIQRWALTIACTLMTTAGAGAATRTWTGAVDGSWSTPGNWSEGTAPVTGDALVFPAGAVNRRNLYNSLPGASVASLWFDNFYYVQSGYELGLTDGLTGTDQAEVVIGIQLNVRKSQTWSLHGPTSRLNNLVRLVWDAAGAGDPRTLTLDVTRDLEIRMAGAGSVVHTGGGQRSVSIGTALSSEHSAQQNHRIDDGWLTLNDAGYRTVGHSVTLNGDSCTTPPCDDGVTFTSSWNQSPLILGRVSATGGMVQVSRLGNPAPKTYAGELTLGPNVVFEAAVSLSQPRGPLTIGPPSPTGYAVEGSGTVSLNGATLSVIATEFAACVTRTLIDNDGTDAIAGTFAGLPEGAAFTTASGERFRISYVGGTGNDVTITGIDEGPETCGAWHADLSGDRKGDVVWRHATTGENYLWRMNGLEVTARQPINTIQDPDWRIAGLGDFNGDGKSDIFWRHTLTGDNYLYLMDGATIVERGPVSVVDPDVWELAAIGDFDGDLKSDLVWRTRHTGENYLYLMDGRTIRSARSIDWVADTHWKIAAAGDLNNDGRDDLVWYHTLSGGVYGWLMDGFTPIGRGHIAEVSDLNWKIVAVRDLDSDGYADLFWWNETTGATYVYRIYGTTVLDRRIPDVLPDLQWKAAAVADYDGDGRADVLWRHASSGAMYVWMMAGLTLHNRGSLPQVPDSGWSVIP